MQKTFTNNRKHTEQVSIHLSDKLPSMKLFLWFNPPTPLFQGERAKEVSEACLLLDWPPLVLQTCWGLAVSDACRTVLHMSVVGLATSWFCMVFIFLSGIPVHYMVLHVFGIFGTVS